MELQSYHLLEGPVVYMDRASGSGRESVARLCNAIVANVDGIEVDAQVDALWTHLQVIPVGRAE